MGKASQPPGPARRWLRVTLWTAAGVSTLLAAREVKQRVLDDPRFVVHGLYADAENSQDFAIGGLQYASRARVVRVFQGDFGKNVFRVPIAERRRQLLAIDWVADASVSRLWPNRIVVRIWERKPVAFVSVPRDPAHPQTSRLALIDRDGVILEQPARARFSFPVVRGVYEQQPEAERREKMHHMLRLFDELGPLGKDISEVEVSSSDLRVTMQVSGRAVDLILGSRNFSKRMRNFLEYYQEIHKRSPGVTSFDLRLDDRITARE